MRKPRGGGPADPRAADTPEPAPAAADAHRLLASRLFWAPRLASARATRAASGERLVPIILCLSSLPSPPLSLRMRA